MNINYSQFYRGATTIPTSGGGTVGPRQLVKYEFNTRDEQGNKVMDKMSREETLAAMKEIRSQYGDDVMIEFSGDGMAALVEGGKNADLDGIVKPDEAKQAAFQDTIIQMENTHVVKTTEDAPGRMDILKEKAPNLYNEIQELNHNIINHKNGEKYGHRFLELHKRAEKVLNAAAEEETRVEQTGETQLSQKAQKLLEKLRKKYGNIDFMVGDYDNAEDAKKLLSGGTKETSVLFSVEELEKMASSTKTENEYMNRIQDVLGKVDEIQKKYGFVTSFGVSFDKDGIMSYFAALENTAEKKKTTVQGSGIEDLFAKIDQIDWSKIGEEE